MIEEGATGRGLHPIRHQKGKALTMSLKGSRGDYGGNYDGDSASDSGEENASPSRSELEQLKDLIIEFRREQSQQ
ncbi:hypothetical protein BHE90_017316 [Fusarium euwallaceae]|uniref:Uncharacterized protein n=1 Tax=Fusarium euwallaceae TaxID=1147111 RepID=A0A430KXS9_9HYPO|nr:hypothetical protein BHE90_017316 [Fusarium euwallaceae]